MEKKNSQWHNSATNKLKYALVFRYSNDLDVEFILDPCLSYNHRGLRLIGMDALGLLLPWER